MIVEQKKAVSKQEQIFISNSLSETISFGRTLAGSLKAGDVVAFYGDIGAGKTTLIRGICAGLHCESVSSPTFTLINEYEGDLPIYHFDFYRIESQEELWQLGCEEYFAGAGVCLIEWPEKASAILPETHIEIRMRALFDELGETGRDIRVYR